MERRGEHLAPGECYSWKVTPLAGGPLEVDNIERVGLEVRQSVLSEVARALGPHQRSP